MFYRTYYRKNIAIKINNSHCINIFLFFLIIAFFFDIYEVLINLIEMSFNHDFKAKAN